MHGYARNKGALIKRLHRIEGQVRGIEGMVEEDRYCIDIITQIAAARAALARRGPASARACSTLRPARYDEW